MLSHPTSRQPPKNSWKPHVGTKKSCGRGKQFWRRSSWGERGKHTAGHEHPLTSYSGCEQKGFEEFWDVLSHSQILVCAIVNAIMMIWTEVTSSIATPIWAVIQCLHYWRLFEVPFYFSDHIFCSRPAQHNTTGGFHCRKRKAAGRLQVLGHHSSQLSPWDCRGFKVWLSEIDLLGSIWGHGFTGGSLADIHFFGWRSQHTWWLLDVMGTIQTAPFKAGELWARSRLQVP